MSKPVQKMPKTVVKLSDYRRLINNPGVSVTAFVDPSCEPCKDVSAELNKVEQSFPNVLFLIVNVEQSEEIAAVERIAGLPTFTFHIDGLRLEPSTLQGAEPARLRHCLTNLLRPCEYLKEQKKPPAPVQPVQPVQPQPTQPEPKSALKSRQREFIRPDRVAPNVASAPPPGQVIQVQNVEHYTDEVIGSRGLIVVQFSRDQCLATQRMAPFLEHLASMYGQVKFLAVNTDQLPDLASSMEVVSPPLPVFMIGANGRQKQKFEATDLGFLEARIKYWLAQ